MTELDDLHRGDVLEAQWGRYVYDGAPLDGGRVVLREVGKAGTYVLPELERLWTDYQKVGHEQPRESAPRAPAPAVREGTPAREARVEGASGAPDRDHDGAPRRAAAQEPPRTSSSPAGVGPLAVEAAPAPAGAPPVAREGTRQEGRDGRLCALQATGASDVGVLDAVPGVRERQVPVGAVPLPPQRRGGVTHTTLGAIRPLATLRGMVPGSDGAGSFVTVPDVETRYWQPCAVDAGEKVDLGRGPEHIPHVFFVASSWSPTIYCPAHQKVRGRSTTGLSEGPAGAARAQVAADAPAAGPPTPAAERATPPPVSEVGSVSVPRAVETVVPPVVTSGSASDGSGAPLSAKDEVADFSGPSRGVPAGGIETSSLGKQGLAGHHERPAKPRACPAWWNDPPRPNRIDFERAAWWNERAAVLEYEAGLPRAEAEVTALADLEEAFRRGEIW